MSFRSVEMFFSSLLLLLDCRAPVLTRPSLMGEGALRDGCMLSPPLRSRTFSEALFLSQPSAQNPLLHEPCARSAI